MHTSQRRVVAATLAVVLLAVVAGCSRSGSSTTAGTAPSGTSAATGSSGAPMNGQFGTITTPVCGKAPSGSSATVSAADVGATTGKNVLGLTASTIRIGTISDVGYSGYPGLNQELYDASDVFVSWCNALGGINGHKIQIDHLDAKLFDYKSVIQTACQQDFSLVGGGGVFDNTGQADRLACLLPDFPGYVVTPEARGSDLQVQATNGGSNSAVMFGLANYLNQTYPSAGQAVGYITANTGTTITNKKQYQEAGASLGWKTVYDTQYNATGEPTWLPFAQAIKDKGVKGLYFVGSAAPLAGLVAALAQIDYKLDWVAGPQNMYDPALVKQAGGALEQQPGVHQRRHHAVHRHRRAGHPPVRAALQHLPAQRAQDGLTGTERLRGLVAVRPIGQGVRQRHHPPVRVPARHPHDLVRRGRAERSGEPVHAPGADQLLRARQGHAQWVLHHPLQGQPRAVQLLGQQRVQADRQLWLVDHLRQRAEPGRPEVT